MVQQLVVVWQTQAAGSLLLSPFLIGVDRDHRCRQDGGELKYLRILGAHGRVEELGEDRVQRAFVARAGWLRLIHRHEPTSWSAVASRSRTSRPCLTRPNYSQSRMDLEGGAGRPGTDAGERCKTGQIVPC
jgi:hypothetical protein